MSVRVIYQFSQSTIWTDAELDKYDKTPTI